MRADRTRPTAYADVAGREWDEVVELSSEPGSVRSALTALGERARHWTLVSTVSVYASNSEPGADEGAALLPAEDLQDHGQAKAAAELASREALAGRLLVARAGLIGGPGDGSDRFGYWVSRFALAGQRADGPVLAPVPDGRWVQVVDVDDFAAWLVRAGQVGEVGTLDTTGDQHPLGEVLDLAARVAGSDAQVVTAGDAWLVEHGVGYWAGPRSLPLWAPAADAAVAQRDDSAFHASLEATGLALSPLQRTLQRTLADERARGLDRARRSGLTRSEELDLVTQLG